MIMKKSNIKDVSDFSFSKREMNMKKRGQQSFSMSFGMIFSVILIVVFLVIAFLAVRYFINLGSCSSVGLFYEDLQDSVNEAWKSQSSEFEFEINLPSGISRICFANLSDEITDRGEDYDAIRYYIGYGSNVFLLPPGEACEMAHTEIEHLNVTKITEKRNPYCVDVARDLVIKKDFYDKLVSIE